MNGVVDSFVYLTDFDGATVGKANGTIDGVVDDFVELGAPNWPTVGKVIRLMIGVANGIAELGDSVSLVETMEVVFVELGNLVIKFSSCFYCVAIKL
jgi:hypothetical protein